MFNITFLKKMNMILRVCGHYNSWSYGHIGCYQRNFFTICLGTFTHSNTPMSLGASETPPTNQRCLNYSLSTCLAYPETCSSLRHPHYWATFSSHSEQDGSGTSLLPTVPQSREPWKLPQLPTVSKVTDTWQSTTTGAASRKQVRPANRGCKLPYIHC